MANLQEVVSWEAGIYQLETGDPVLGGPGGVSNKQGQALANRTAYLKKHVDDIEGGNTAAGKADKLSTARNIALAGDVTGQAVFDGSGNITITATYKNSGVVAGTYRSVTVDAKGNITAGSNPTTLAGYGITDAATKTELSAVQTGVDNLGSGTTAAGKANKLTTARNIALAGDVTGQATFDGSGNISITTTYKNSGVTAGTYRSVTVDAKGNITGGTNPTTLSGYGITDAVPSSQLATEAVKGIAAIATQAEVNTGIDDTKFVTAKKLLAWVKQASETVLGMMKVATQLQTDAGTADDVVVTPKKLKLGFNFIASTNGFIAFPSWLGGLIIQWGNIPSIAAGSSAVITFPTTFPNNVLSTIPIAGSNGCINAVISSGGGNKLTSFQACNNLAGSTVTGVGFYLAVGI
ncbi:gp53-like domain-containing protein [Aeromonas sobria]|uniref:gp53-like domain-containing protein n=1 Tax=Aeromonas sobria TaxID=646 RepID=UPI003F33D6BF